MTRLLYLLDLLGVAVFAASGALAAMASGLDLLGVLVIASVTAVGGGTIRDLLLNRHPIFWMQDSAPIFTILSATVVTVLWSQLLPMPLSVLLVADAMGLALFAMSGARLAREGGCSNLVTVFMGTLTGVGGGARCADGQGSVDTAPRHLCQRRNCRYLRVSGVAPRRHVRANRVFCRACQYCDAAVVGHGVGVAVAKPQIPLTRYWPLAPAEYD